MFLVNLKKQREFLNVTNISKIIVVMFLISFVLFPDTVMAAGGLERTKSLVNKIF